MAETEPSSGASATGSPSHLARILRPRLLGVPVLTIALLAFAGYVVTANYVPKRIETLATEKLVAEQQAENESLVRRLAAAETQRTRVETDRWTNERILRDDLGMTRREETILR